MMYLKKIAKASLLLLTVGFGSFSSFCEAATVLPATPQGTIDSLRIAVATDDSNNAVTVFVNDDLIESRYSPGNQTWEANVVISNTTARKSDPDVAMDGSSTALAVWNGFDLDTTNASVEANRLVAGVWGSPEFLEGPTTDDIGGVSVSMNGSGGGVAAWFNFTTDEIHASFFTAGAWAPFEVIGTPAGNAATGYSGNGDAVVTWVESTGNVYGVTSIGLTWQSQATLDANATTNSDVGIDTSGNAIAIWSGDTVGDIRWSRFDGATWSAAQTLSLASGNGQPTIAVAPDGSAVAVWKDAVNDIQLAQFNGTSWTLPISFATGTANPSNIPTVSMDSAGNALIGWIASTNEIYTALLPLGGTLDFPELIAEGNDDLIFVDVALSIGGQGVPAWVDQEVDINEISYATFVLFDAAPIPPTPPTGIDGSVCKNSFAMQSDRVHIITFDPSTDPTTVSYYIYRNGALVSIVPASGPFIYYDHNRTKGSPDTYTVYAVNAEGVLSTPVSITLD